MSSFWNLWVLSYMVKDVIQLKLLRRANSGLPRWALSQWQTSLQETQRGQTQRRGRPHDPGGGARSAAATSPGMLTATRRGSLPLEPLWGVELQASRNVTRIHFCCFKRSVLMLLCNHMKWIQVQFSEGRAQSFHQTLKEVLMNPTRSKNFYCRGLSKILYEQGN